MSKHFPWPSLAIATGTMLLAAGVPAHAQVELERTARARAIEARAATVAARDAFVSSRHTATAALSDSQAIGGMLLRWSTDSIPESDVERIADGVREAQASLEGRFGDAGVALLAGLSLKVLAPQRMFRGSVMRLVTSLERGGQIYSTKSPVNPERVRDYLLGQAGTRLWESHPRLRLYPSSTLSLEETATDNALAARAMSMMSSGPGRRCATGAISACRAILTPATGARAMALWYDPEDDRSIAVATRHYQLPADKPELARAREECTEDGEATACRTIVAALPATYPYGAIVRGSLMAHALELGGADGLHRLQTDTVTPDPLALLASVAGVSEDSLITAWQRAGTEAVDEQSGSFVPLSLSAFFWCGLLLFGATRRRPA